MVFALDELAFALELGAVEKIVRAVEVTPLPGAPQGVLGVVSIAGKFLPVIDLRARFGLEPRAVRSTDHFAIVGSSRRTLALLVDAPVEVTSTSAAEIAPADPAMSRMPSLRGVAQLGGGIVLVHDLERFLSAEDESALEAALTGATERSAAPAQSEVIAG